jgi:CRISPR-associated protein Cas1
VTLHAMPLFPPPRPVEHPADLVIDVFGTFLGRRSERMVVRWREAGGVSPAAVLSAVAEGGDPAGEDGTQPSSEPVAIPLNVPKAATPSGQLASSSNDDHPGDTPGQSSTGSPRRDRSHPADHAASELLQLWGRQASPPDGPASRPKTQWSDQLDDIAERPAGRGPLGAWQERAVPMSRLRSLTISGRGITVSSDLIAALVERGIAISFLSGRGQPVAQLSAPGLGGTVQTRRSQLAAYESPLGVDLAVEFIRGKLRNQKHQLQYSGKYLKSADATRFDRLVRKIKALGALRKQLADFKADRLEDVRDKLMGYEGTGARLYWEGVGILLEGRMDFPGRSTRGALDPINSALNYGYGILYSKVSGAIANAGLEVYAGFLHVDRPGKPALVLDLVEEFRAPIVDRSVLAIVNQGIAIETDAHGLTAPTKKLLANRILERLSTLVPYEGKRWSLGTIIQNQARHLAVAVRGERTYRAFASRW